MYRLFKRDNYLQTMRFIKLSTILERKEYLAKWTICLTTMARGPMQLHRLKAYLGQMYSSRQRKTQRLSS